LKKNLFVVLMQFLSCYLWQFSVTLVRVISIQKFCTTTLGSIACMEGQFLQLHKKIGLAIFKSWALISHWEVKGIQEGTFVINIIIFDGDFLNSTSIEQKKICQNFIFEVGTLKNTKKIIVEFSVPFLWSKWRRRVRWNKLF